MREFHNDIVRSHTHPVILISHDSTINYSHSFLVPPFHKDEIARFDRPSGLLGGGMNILALVVAIVQFFSKINVVTELSSQWK